MKCVKKVRSGGGEEISPTTPPPHPHIRMEFYFNLMCTCQLKVKSFYSLSACLPETQGFASCLPSPPAPPPNFWNPGSTNECLHKDRFYSFLIHFVQRHRVEKPGLQKTLKIFWFKISEDGAVYKPARGTNKSYESQRSRLSHTLLTQHVFVIPACIIWFVKHICIIVVPDDIDCWMQ